MNKIDFDKLLKLSFSIGIILVSFSISYRYLIFLPQKEKELALQQKEKELQSQRLVEENKLKLAMCLEGVSKAYGEVWAKNCQSYADYVKTGFKDCVDTLTAMEPSQKDFVFNLCKSKWGAPNYSKDCSLPNSISDDINEGAQSKRDECYKQYSIN